MPTACPSCATDIRHHRARTIAPATGCRRPHIFNRLVAIGPLQPRLRQLDRQRRRPSFAPNIGARDGARIPGADRSREEERIVGNSFEARPGTVNRLLGANGNRAWDCRARRVVGVPAAQHRRARLRTGTPQDRGAAPDPARGRIADQGLRSDSTILLDRTRRIQFEDSVLRAATAGGRV